jgi:hypothetical protein
MRMVQPPIINLAKHQQLKALLESFPLETFPNLIFLDLIALVPLKLSVFV